MPAHKNYGAVIIGGGFFGCRLALLLKKEFSINVLLLEKGPDLLLRASYHNQARVHNGYHYPRSVITAMRSRINFPRFVDEFRPAVVNDFDKYYAVARNYSKVTAQQFRIFFDRIEAPLKPVPKPVEKLFNPDLIERLFTVQEYAFNADVLRAQLKNQLELAGADVRLNCPATSVKQAEGGSIDLHYEDRNLGQTVSVNTRAVFNCTYSNINTLLANSGLPKINLKQELTEMAAVQVPPQIEKLGITVMCGPFFSVMPFPSLGLHSFSHVRYTPHRYWYDKDMSTDNDTLFDAMQRQSNFVAMQKDAARYMPILAECEFKRSLWEVKTLLPASEGDDSRPILFNESRELPGLVSIMGGKIDNIYDMETEVLNLNLQF